MKYAAVRKKRVLTKVGLLISTIGCMSASQAAFSTEAIIEDATRGRAPHTQIESRIQVGHASDRDEKELEIIGSTLALPKSDSFLQRNERFDTNTKTFVRASTTQKIGLGFVGVIGTSISFTLEVLGATGAFWGATDVFNLRDEKNNAEFQIAAMAVGGIAFVRYLSIHAFNRQKHRDYLAGINKSIGFGKVSKAFEMPVSAVKAAVEELIGCNKDFERNSQEAQQDDIDADTAVLLKCSTSNVPLEKDCNDTGDLPQLRHRDSKKKLYECQISPI